MVYKDAEKLYAEVRKDGQEMIEEAFTALFPKVLHLDDPTMKSISGRLIGYNTTFFPRRDVVVVPLQGPAASLKSQLVQTSKDGSVGYALMDSSAEGGARISQCRGLYADSMAVSGK